MSLRYQKMTSHREWQRLKSRILATPMDVRLKHELINELEQYGRKAVPEVAKRFKEARRVE